jgi:hypothetical protein
MEGGVVATNATKGNTMKTTVLSVLACALFATGALQVQAQSGTNVTLNVNIALTGVAPNGDTATHVKISTKDVIAALADATGTSFSSKAKLLIVFPSGGSPSFLVRDGGTDTSIDTGFLSVNRNSSVSSIKTANSGLMSGSEAAIDHIALSTGTLSFDVQGYTTDSVSNRGIKDHTILDETSPVSYNSKVNGTGSNDSVLQGVISSSGRKVELVP